LFNRKFIVVRFDSCIHNFGAQRKEQPVLQVQSRAQTDTIIKFETMKSYKACSIALCALAGSSSAFTPNSKKSAAFTKNVVEKKVVQPLNVGSTFDDFRRKRNSDEGRFDVKAGDIVLEPAYSLGYGSVFIGFLLTLLFSGK